MQAWLEFEQPPPRTGMARSRALEGLACLLGTRLLAASL